MEKFSHPDETVPTMYVDRGGVAFRINIADYDGKETVHAASHYTPAATVADVVETPPKPEKPAKATKVEPVVEPPVAPAQSFVVGPDADGKFWRTDKDGVHLIATPFDTAADAAAAVIPA